MSAVLDAPISADRCRARRLSGVLAWAAFAFVVFFHGFTVATSGDVREEAPFDYYNLLVDGLRSGHLYLAHEPDPRLIALPDPYDPARNASIRLGDASYFRGHYYLYFGITPAVTLLLPYACVTGHHLPQAVAVYLFCVVGLAAGSWMIVKLLRLFKEDIPVWLPATAILVFGIGSHVAALTRRPEVWELPIAAAFAFTFLSMAAVLRATESAKPARWMAFAGLCLGLAVGARPTAVLACGLLAVGLVAIWRTCGRRTAMESALAAATTLAVVLLGLAWYNYARFGSCLQFGQAYQLTSIREGGVTHFSARYFLHNLRVYFAWPVRWGWHFPFLSARALPPAPTGYYAGEELYCIAALSPFVWFSVGAWLLVNSRDRVLRFGAAALGAITVPVLLVLLAFFSATERYMVEFLPSLMLLATLGAAALLANTSSKQRRAGFTATVALFAVATAVAGVLASFDYHGQSMRRTAPETWRRIATLADKPVAQVRRALGFAPSNDVGGVLRFDAQFDAIPVGATEPLLVLGHAPNADVFAVRRASKTDWVFLHDHWGAPVHVAPPVRIEPGQTHIVTIDAPNCTAPVFGMPLAGDVIITVDGGAVFRVWSDTYGTTPDEVFVGRNPIGATTCATMFHGRIEHVQWLH